MTDNINRREFIKTAGMAGLAMSGLSALAGCSNTPGEVAAGENAQMTMRTNPGNGDKVSILGYGCMRWPMIKDEEGKDIVDQEAVNSLVDYAIEHGVNYFDTSPVYLQGQSEQATGIALKRHPRESYFLATKLSNFSNYTRENSMLMYKKSFENLQTDYFDYYLLHSIGGGGIEAFNQRFVDNGMIDFLMEERKAGRIRNLGFSFHGAPKGWDELMATHEQYHWDFVQIQLNWSDWTHAGKRNTNADYLYAELTGRNIPVVVMEPLLGGKLANPPKHVADRLKEKAPSKSVASWAFRFAASPSNILTVLSGMTYMEHLEDNISTFSPLVAMDEKEMAFMDETAELMEKHPTIKCTRCQYCMPCPYGVDIPGIFSHYNKCVNEGFIVGNPESENYRKARRAYLISYDRRIGQLSQADRCIGCNKCVSKCPQGISIPWEIRKIDRYIEELRRNIF